MSGIDDAFVPEWKRELIRKKQMWKNSGGWSVPPVTRPQSECFTRVSDGFRYRINLRKSTTDLSNSMNEMSPEDVAYDDVFPLVKAQSAENILDEKQPVEKQRRVSTTPYGFRKTAAVPRMEDFLRKYRKSSSSKKPQVEINQNEGRPVFEKSNWKQSVNPLCFIDVNRNELPPPNMVKKTVEAFEQPKDSSSPDVNHSPVAFDDVNDSPISEETRASIRDVVKRFEAQIRSAATTQKSNSHVQTKIDDRPTPTIRKTKHVTFDADVIVDGTLNVSVNGKAKIVNNMSTDDMKTVTINTNQSFVIKAV